jgi:hypothetical protein
MITANGSVSGPPYWVATLDDGTMASETSSDWNEVKDRVVSLRMNVDGKWHSLPDNMECYIQAKTVSAPVGGGEITIESRYIGFRNGNYEYYLRVDEYTGDVSVETKEVVK